MNSPVFRRRATLIGFTVILMWGALALPTVWSGSVPPFQLVAMCFAIAIAGALVKWIADRENPLDHLGQSWPVWLLGVGGCSATTSSISWRCATRLRSRPG